MATVTIPTNPVFKPVHRSRERYVIMKGSAGSGKSVDTAQQYIIRLLQNSGRNLVCVRKSDITHRDSTFAELTGAINRLGLDSYFFTGLSPLMITCIANGNQVLFRGMNDITQREKLKSITFQKGKLTDVWIEEATEITQEDFEIIDDRLRGELPRGLFYQIKATFNPVHQSHWLKKVFFDRQDPDVLTHHSTYLDNRFIDEAYKRRMARRRMVDPDGYRVYGLGEWGETSGLILKNWEPYETSSNLNDYDAVAIGQDFGFNHANAVLLLGLKDNDIYIISEIYVFEKDTAEIIEIAEKAGLPKDVDMYCDSAEPDRIKTWRNAGFRAVAVKKEKTTDRKYQATQIDWLKQRRIYVNPACVNTIRELEQWQWSRDKTTGEYLDIPVPFGDDAMAALRYGVEPWRKSRRIKTFSKADWGLM